MVWRFFIFILFFTSQAYSENFTINIGASKTLRLNGSARIKGRGIIHAEEKAGSLFIRGQREGVATISTNNSTYKIFVVDKKSSNLYTEFNKILANFMGLKVEMQNGNVVVTGQLLRLSDWQDLSAKAQELNAPYIMRADFDPDILVESQTWLKDQVRNILPQANSIKFQNGIQLLWPKDQESKLTPYLLPLGTLGIDVVYEKDTLQIEPLVRVRIVVAEVNKKLQSQLGIQWPEAVSAQIVPKFNGVSAFEIFLKALESNGMGQVLASPNLLARSGSEAEFLAGGEFGIKIIRGKMRDVIWKKHGILLKIKPKADQSGRLSIELTTEVSMIDGSQSVDGIPALKTNRMSTHFDLTQARTIALSGLIRNDWGKEQSGVWGLSQIPILGGLFRSESFYNNKTELVIFVTPEILREEQMEPHSLLPKGWSQNE